MLTLFGKVAEHLFGHKYYSVVLEEPHVRNSECECPRTMSGYIFRTKEDATIYFYQMKGTRKFQSVEIISFRSRKEYKPFNTNYLIDTHS